MPTTLSRQESIEQRVEIAARRFGYLLAAAINGFLLWCAHRLLDWEWPNFLTPEFDDLLPIVTVAFVVSIAVNLVLAWNDAGPRKSVANLVTSAFGFLAAVRTLRVFPFDFSAYATDWSWLARMVVILAIIGTAIAFVVELVKLVAVTKGERS